MFNTHSEPRINMVIKSTGMSTSVRSISVKVEEYKRVAQMNQPNGIWNKIWWQKKHCHPINAYAPNANTIYIPSERMVITLWSDYAQILYKKVLFLFAHLYACKCARCAIAVADLHPILGFASCFFVRSWFHGHKVFECMQNETSKLLLSVECMPQLKPHKLHGKKTPPNHSNWISSNRISIASFVAFCIKCTSTYAHILGIVMFCSSFLLTS